jgi:hypothetical protein
VRKVPTSVPLRVWTYQPCTLTSCSYANTFRQVNFRQIQATPHLAGILDLLATVGGSVRINPALVDEEGAAAEEGMVQRVVQQGGHRRVVIWMVLRAEVLDGEDGVGGDALVF